MMRTEANLTTEDTESTEKRSGLLSVSSVFSVVKRIGTRPALLVIFISLPLPLMAAEGKIHKVLPHFVDKEGRHTLSPSLYERDAYQAKLRNNPEERGGMRFDVHWKAKKSSALKLRVEMRGSRTNEPTHLNVEMPVKEPGLFSKWSAVPVRREDYLRLGELRSWRVTLLDAGQVVAEQRSFLW